MTNLQKLQTAVAELQQIMEKRKVKQTAKTFYKNGCRELALVATPKQSELNELGTFGFIAFGRSCDVRADILKARQAIVAKAKARLR